MPSPADTRRVDTTRYLISEDESSDPSQYTFDAATGTWGEMIPPTPALATAFSTGRKPGLDAGDTVHIWFDIPTNMPPMVGSAAAAAAVAWTSPVGNTRAEWVAWDELRVREGRVVWQSNRLPARVSRRRAADHILEPADRVERVRHGRSRVETARGGCRQHLVR